MARSLGIFCVYSLLTVTWIWGHDTDRINSLDRKLKNRLKRMRVNFQDDLYDTEEKIKADVRSDLPDIIQTTLFELLREGQIDSFSRHHAQNEIRTLKRNVNQLKAGMLHLKRKLVSTEEEQRRQKEELEKIRSESKVFANNITALKKQLTQTKCECGRNNSLNVSIASIIGPEACTVGPEKASVETPTPVAVGGTEFTRLLAVSVSREQFYQFDLKNYSKTTFPLKAKGVRDVVFDGATRSIIWANYKAVSGIYSMNIDNKKIIPVVRGINVDSLAVDNGLLFFGKFSTPNSINKMTLSSENYTQIADTGIYKTYSIALDRINRRLFWSDLDKLKEMDYDGGQRGIVIRGLITCVVVDALTQMLYYNMHAALMKLNLKKARRNGSFVGEVPKPVYDMVYYRGLIYTGDYSSQQIRVTNQTSVLTKVISSLDSGVISLCLIP